MSNEAKRPLGGRADLPTLFLCSCEKTMPLDSEAVRRGCPSATVVTADRLCGSEVERLRGALGDGRSIVVGCTQEIPLFLSLANRTGEGPSLSFVNIRETAGWAQQACEAGPKMAALLAAGLTADPAAPVITFESGGVILIYGRGEQALEAAALLKDHLDVTVMIMAAEVISPPPVNEFPIVRGSIQTVKGHIGAFTISVDDFATAAPSSRDSLTFGPTKNGATAHCDIILDISGNPPLVGAFDFRDGYIQVDPRDPAALLRAVIKARDLTGIFDKPRYIELNRDICAHARSRVIGCRRCLDLCPAGAIAPDGDHVAVDPAICAGCGQCAAACPTGAAAYTMPPVESLIRKLRILIRTYRAAGGLYPVILFHDGDHGRPLIEALARHGPGLPANVLPFAVNEVTQIGPETVAATFAYGASDIRLLVREKPRHSIEGLHRTITLVERIASALGFGSVEVIASDDPDSLQAQLEKIEPHAPTAHPAEFYPEGAKREVMKFALRELHGAAPTPVDIVALPPDAPFGKVEIDVGACTLCLACVSACPTGALRDDPEYPRLRFVEDACVQCGLCKATCPEKAVTLIPQLDFRTAMAAPVTLKEEEPFRCIRCEKPFGVKSTIERVIGRLAGQHWMYAQGSKRLDALRMCEECRLGVITDDGLDPHGARPRAAVRTTDDYLRDREVNSSAKE
jgi:ferredoxin